MTKSVLACVDARGYPSAVCDGAAWSAVMLGAPLTLLHVLPADRDAAGADGTTIAALSPASGWHTTDLMPELDMLEAQKEPLAQAHGRQLLEGVRARAQARGAHPIELQQHCGSLLHTLEHLHEDAQLIVMGLHRHQDWSTSHQLHHHVERAIHAIPRSFLIVTQDSFEPPTSFVLACDGSAQMDGLVAAAAQQPMLHGRACHLVHAGKDHPEVHARMVRAGERLAAAGIPTHLVREDGPIEQILARHVAIQQAPLIVMGAFGHGRLQHLLAGSTTSSILRHISASVLVLR